MPPVLRRNGALAVAAVAGFAIGIIASPQFLDSPTACFAGFLATAIVCFWLAAESRLETKWTVVRAKQAESLALADSRVDELSDLPEQARTDITAYTSDRPNHECDLHGDLMRIVEDGSLSIDAYNRARAGLPPAPAENAEA